ncbi:hypothetical protein ACG33_07325 [Steroidobacter denitrificans]|uniref:Uncharacterized protein n=1 Tax=Steroidobacter denitrificans TaxID=465721 RepID=A0A127FBI4_STEDE|nr:hypothetical protein ACG33_07325 [Steroidobacter denitrificans]
MLLAAPPAAGEALRAQYAEHPLWNVQLLHDNLRIVLAVADPPVPCPSYASVRRYLKAHGLTRKRAPRRGNDEICAGAEILVEREIRSYEVRYVLQLLHLDFHHGSRKVLTRAGEWIIYSRLAGFEFALEQARHDAGRRNEGSAPHR